MRVGLLLPLVMFAAGCGTSGSGSLQAEHAQAVQAVTLDLGRGERSLSVMAGCLDKGRLVLESETPSTVKLRYFVRRWKAGSDPMPTCATTSTVQLAAPLGARRVEDAASGQQVRIIGR